MKTNVRLVVATHPYIAAGYACEFPLYGTGLTQEMVTEAARSRADSEFGIRWQQIMVVLFDGKHIYDNWLIEKKS